MKLLANHRLGSLSWMLLFVGGFTAHCFGQALPSQGEILTSMRLANDYFMDKWPDPTVDIVTDKVRPSNLWTRATYYEGLMAMYGIDPLSRYYDYAVEWGEGHDWEPAYGGTYSRDADHHAAGQTYLELYEIDPQPQRILPIKTTIDRVVNGPESDDWWWIDALHMAMPVFAKLGVIYDDDRYFERMHDLYHFTKTQHGENGLYNPVDHLWWRDSSFDPPHTAPNGEDTYWSRGNGWVFAALARVLDVLPTDAPHRAEYATTFQEMADALLPIQRTDGFWNVSLHDPNDFGGPETSGTAFFVYGLSWGLNHGFLSGEQYEAAATAGWNGLVQDALHPDGFLGYVQSTGKQPSDGQPLAYDTTPDFEDFGLGAFLLAGSEIYPLSGEALPGDADGDGDIDLDDLDVISSNFRNRGNLGLAGDVNLDGVVDLYDFRYWKANYTHPAQQTSGTVPEPCGSSLVLVSLLLLGTRRIHHHDGDTPAESTA